MKLLAQTNKRYFLIYLFALLASSLALLFGTRYVFDHYADERLLEMQAEIADYIQKTDSLPPFFQSIGLRLTATPGHSPTLASISDTLIFNSAEAEQEPFRKLLFPASIKGENQQIEILQSVVETEDIVEVILLLNSVIILLTFLSLYLVQRKMSASLWQPFYDTLKNLRSFQIHKNTPLDLTATHIDELNELYASLQKLTDQTRQDYQILKRFTENASHEIQTPLAVISAQLEALQQSGHLDQKEAEQIHTAQKAARRLSRLQQELFLLAKIENNQFQANQPIDTAALILARLDILQEFIAAKSIHLSTDIESVTLSGDPFLLEMMVNNLLGNAVKHNTANAGRIDVYLRDKILRVSNTAAQPDLPVTELKERFRRGQSQSGGLGLGLAIIEEISHQCGFQFACAYEAGTWTSTINF